MVLRGQTPMRHAFGDGSGLCVVPLTLSLRNCLPQTASLSVEAGLTVEAAQRDGAAFTGALAQICRHISALQLLKCLCIRLVSVLFTNICFLSRIPWGRTLVAARVQLAFEVLCACDQCGYADWRRTWCLSQL